MYEKNFISETISKKISLRPQALVLDVRGAMLDPILDEYIDERLLFALYSCLKKGIKVALITGTSIATLQTYLLNPLGDLGNQVLKNNLYAYTETGCHGYYFINGNSTPDALEEYEPLTLDVATRTAVLDAIEKVSSVAGVNGRVETRKGQVNFYLDASRQDRNNFAKVLKDFFISVGIKEINIMVPSAKSVIDISLANKYRSVADFMRRINLSEFNKVVFISDSLQVDGSDAELYKKMTGVRAFHVGPNDNDICEDVVMVGEGPEGSYKILNHISTI
jgi:hypothetical protein